MYNYVSKYEDYCLKITVYIGKDYRLTRQNFLRFYNTLLGFLRSLSDFQCGQKRLRPVNDFGK